MKICIQKAWLGYTFKWNWIVFEKGNISKPIGVISETNMKEIVNTYEQQKREKNL